MTFTCHDVDSIPLAQPPLSMITPPTFLEGEGVCGVKFHIYVISLELLRAGARNLA